jgi:hypothetical protein
LGINDPATLTGDGAAYLRGAVEKFVTSIFTKLNLRVSQLDHRRVLAVLHYLDS